jgi:hypothetical protein
MATIVRVASHDNRLAGIDSATAYLLFEAGTATPTWTALPAIPAGTPVDCGTANGALYVVNSTGVTYRLVSLGGSGGGSGFAWRPGVASP